MGGSACKLVGVDVKWKDASAAASAALATITEGVEASKTYVASLFGAAASAAASAYEAVKSTAADASRSVVELVRRLIGSDAAAAAKRKLEEVVQLLRAGASSASDALAAALGTCLDVVPKSVRKEVAALSDFGSCLAERAASAYEAVKSAAADASRSVVELVRRLFGSDAAAPAKRKLEEVVQLLRAGASSASAALGTCVDVVPKSVRKEVGALLDFGSSAADAMALVRSIHGVEELLAFSISTEAKIAITVAVVLYLKFFCSPAGAVAGAMMKAPGGGGLMILRSAFEANPKLYFSILRSAGPAAAAAAF